MPRWLGVGQDRTAKTLLRFFKVPGRERTAALQFICSDMWQPYRKVIAKKAGQAIHILDRFHIAARRNKALDEIRAGEAKEMARQGYEPVLKRSRWCFLKREENLTAHQRTKLADLLQYDLKSVRGYLLKQSFQLLWEYASPYWAVRLLDGWVGRAMRSRLEPIKAVARSIRNHREPILNWFKAKKKPSCEIVEGPKRKTNRTHRKTYGYRVSEATKIAICRAHQKPTKSERTHEAWGGGCEKGFLGIKFHIPAFDYDNERGFPVYEPAARHGLVCLFHAGVFRMPEPLPEERLSSARCRPIMLDAIANAFPSLRMIIAHLGVCWGEEAVTLCRIPPSIRADFLGAAGGWRAGVKTNLRNRIIVVDGPGVFCSNTGALL
jgi:hypothetical protein